MTPPSSTPALAALAKTFPPVVVSLHRPDAVSGVSSAGARLARLGAAQAPWIPLVIGPHSLGHDSSPLMSSPGFSRVSWPDDADPIEQCLLVRDRLRHLGASVVVPNDLPQGFVAAALDRHLGLRLAAWVHGDDHDWDELMMRAAPLVHAWAGVNSRIIRRTQAVAPSLGPARGVLTACVDVPPAPSPMGTGDSSVSPLRLLYTGRLEKKHKRVLDLAKLADALHAKGVDFVLSVAGAGPAETELAERLWPHVLAGRANLLGAVPLDTIPRLVRANHLLILCSQCEGAPTSVMEAMAQGRPVAISSGCGLATDLLRNGLEGISFPIGDIDSLAGRLAAVAADHGWLPRAGAAAHALALQQFAPQCAGSRADALIRAALATPTRASTDDPPTLWKAIVHTMHLLGPTPRDSLSRLAIQWSRDRGEPATSLPSDLDQLPTREGRMLLVVLARLSAGGARRIALYGAGWHTRKLVDTLTNLPDVVAIIDDRAGPEHALPSHLASKPVVTPSQARSLSLDAIVISSDEHESEMMDRAASWAKGVPVVPLYRAA